MQKTLSSWGGAVLCASVLLLVGCGDGSNSGSASATAPVEPLAIQNISITSKTACAVRGDGAARCWGGYAARNWDQSKKMVTGPLKQLMLEYGNSDPSCALNQMGTVFCWSQYGNIANLGRGALQDKGDPKQPVAVLSNVVQIATNMARVCALTNDGDVYCWGEDLADRPTKTMGLPKITQMSVGYDHQCAVGVDSSLWCWGQFRDGSDGIGRNTQFKTETPFRVEIPRGGASQVSVLDSSCAVSVISANVYCWGRNDFGQIGNNDEGISALYPQKVILEDGEMVQQVSLGALYACAMLKSGAARCWGSKRVGVLGNGEGTMGSFQGGEAKPVMVKNSQGEFFGFKGIAMAQQTGTSGTTCAWGEGNQAWCWGYGGDGQLGDGEEGLWHYVNTPKRVKAIESGWI